LSALRGETSLEHELRYWLDALRDTRTGATAQSRRSFFFAQLAADGAVRNQPNSAGRRSKPRSA